MAYDIKVCGVSRQEDYFPVNVHGMAALRSLMRYTGMLDEDEAKDQRDSITLYREGHERGEEVDAWIAFENGERDEPAAVEPPDDQERNAWAAFHTDGPQAGETEGIPQHKLMSNENWVVFPGEIQRALEVYDASGQGADELAQLVVADELKLGELAPERASHEAAVVRELWEYWIRCLRLAAEHGGLVVS